MLPTPDGAEKFRLLRQQRSHSFPAAVDAGLHRAHIGAGHVRDLLIVVPVKVRKQDGLPLFERQLQQGAGDRLPHSHAFEVLGRALSAVRNVERNVIIFEAGVEGFGRPAAAAAQLVFAFICRDAEQPAPKTAAFEALDRLVRREKRLLRSVFGGSLFSDEAQTKVEDSTLITLNETVECVKVAVL